MNSKNSEVQVLIWYFLLDSSVFDRRNEEMRRSHVQQRQEYMKRRDPQCYVRNEDDEEGEDEDKGLMSEPEQKMGAPDLTNRPQPKEPETMRVSDHKQILYCLTRKPVMWRATFAKRKFNSFDFNDCVL